MEQNKRLPEEEQTAQDSSFFSKYPFDAEKFKGLLKKLEEIKNKT